MDANGRGDDGLCGQRAEQQVISCGPTLRIDRCRHGRNLFTIWEFRRRQQSCQSPRLRGRLAPGLIRGWPAGQRGQRRARLLPSPPVEVARRAAPRRMRGVGRNTAPAGTCHPPPSSRPRHSHFSDDNENLPDDRHGVKDYFPRNFDPPSASLRSDMRAVKIEGRRPLTFGFEDWRKRRSCRSPRPEPVEGWGRWPAGQRGARRNGALNHQPRMFHVQHATKAVVRDILVRNADRKSVLHTDESKLYTTTGREYADHQHRQSLGWRVRSLRGTAHTNTIENVFSVFKRGMVGVYQHCGEAHLHRYLAEFDFRYNRRDGLATPNVMTELLAKHRRQAPHLSADW